MHRKEPNDLKSEMPTDLTAYTGHVLLARIESGGGLAFNMSPVWSRTVGERPAKAWTCLERVLERARRYQNSF